MYLRDNFICDTSLEVILYFEKIEYLLVLDNMKNKY
jgi:hypothetical protein